MDFSEISGESRKSEDDSADVDSGRLSPRMSESNDWVAARLFKRSAEGFTAEVSSVDIVLSQLQWYKGVVEKTDGSEGVVEYAL